MALGLIHTLKGQQDTYQGLLLAVFTFKDSASAPTRLYASSHNLNAADGGAAPNGITSFPYNGVSFQTRIKNQELAVTQALSAEGIDITPSVQIDLIDSDKAMWNTYEKPIGFKGAELALYFVFALPGTNQFSSDYRTLFTGICDPGQVSENGLSIAASHRLGMNQIFLPRTRLARRCVRIYPDTTGMSPTDAALLQQAAADDSSVNAFLCGYSNLATGANARGNTPTGDITYRSCNNTLANCIQRLGNPTNPGGSAPYTPYNPVEYDSSGRNTARYAGVQWDQPATFTSRGFGQSKPQNGFNALNEGKYNDYVPMGWGTFWIDPVIMNIVGDANYTEMEVLVGEGEFSSIRHVICNDIDVDKLSTNSSVQKSQIALQLFWDDLTNGTRTGSCNRDNIYNSRGDCYGGWKVLKVHVPSQLTPSSNIPRIRILCDGPKIPIYTDPVTSTLQFSSNPAWIILEVLKKLGWNNSQLSIQSFIDAAPFYDGVNTYNGNSGFLNVASDGITCTLVSGNNFALLLPGDTIFVNGVHKTIATVPDQNHLTISVSFGGFLNNVAFLAPGPNSHARFKLGFGISQRIAGSDLLRQIRTACRTILRPNNTTGLVELVPEQTLALQQSAPVAGSNFNTPITSMDASGAAAVGYVAWRFDYSSILPNGDGTSSLTIFQPGIKNSPNRISFEFTDEDNQWQNDSLAETDAADITRVSRPVDGQVPAIGIPNYDQAERVAATYLARLYRGNIRRDTGGTYNIPFNTSFKCIHLQVGHIVLMDYTQLGLNDDLVDNVSNPINGFLARVIAIKPSANFRTANITIQFHDDNWYIDSFGQSGVNPQKKTQYRNSLNRPAFPWSPYFAQPITGDPLYGHEDWQMGIAVSYGRSKSGQPLANVTASGNSPINVFAKNGLAPPTIGAQGTTAAAGGTVPAGRRYYGQLCGYDSGGKITTPSDPSVPCIIDVPAGADTATLTFPVANWPDGTVNYELFVSTLRAKMSSQKTGAVSGPSTPASITITAYKDDTWGVPDVEFNSLGVDGKVAVHTGTVGIEVAAVTSTTIQVNLPVDNGFGVNQFAPSSGHPYYVMLLGLLNGTGYVPIANWSIASNTYNTLTLAAGINPTTIDRGDGTFGLQLGDVISITMRPTVGSDAGGNYVEDVNWINAANPYFEPHAIVGATNASPIVIQTADDHGRVSGDKVYNVNVLGNLAANGAFYVSVLSPTTLALYSNVGLTVPVAGSGAYTSGGTLRGQDQGLAVNDEIGRELYCALGLGQGSFYKIKSNANKRIYIVGEWLVTPDESSVFFVLESNWSFNAETDDVNTTNSSSQLDLNIGVPNYNGTQIFFQAYTLDGGGHAAFRSQQPWRVIYIFGESAVAGAAVPPGWDVLAPVGTNVTIDLNSGTSSGRHKLLLGSGSTLYALLPPVSTGDPIADGDEFYFHYLQDGSGANPFPTLTGGAGGFSSNAAALIPFVPTAGTTTSVKFTFHGSVWQPSSPITEVQNS